MKKEIRFSAKLDTQEFERTVEALQRKIQTIYKGADVGRMAHETTQQLRKIGIDPGATGVDRSRLYQMEEKARRDADKFLKDQIKDQEKISKQIQEQKNYLKNQLDIAKELKKTGEDRAKQEENIVKAKQQINELENKNKQIEEAKARTLGARPDYTLESALGRIGGIAQRGGVRMGVASIPRVLGRLPNATLAGMAAGAVTGTLSAAGNLIGAGPEANLYAGQAAAIQNERLQRMFKGGALDEMMFAPERKKANEQANQAVVAKSLKDFAATLGKIAAGAVIGGAVAGPAGAVIGGAWAGGGELLGHLGIGPFGERRRQEMEAFKEQQKEQQYRAEIEKTKIKKIVYEDFKAEAPKDVMLQRALGLSDKQLKEFYGTAGGEFSRESMRTMGEQILAAGGTTRGGRETAALGLRLQRDYDLTNAPQILGRLTGVQGSGAAAEKSLAGIFAASVKEGLDKSEFRAENQKFVESVADIVYKTGAADPLAAAMIAERQSRFIADKTTRGMEAARTVGQFVAGKESETTGLGSVLEMGAMLKSPGMRKLGPVGLTAISGMTLEELMALPESQKKYLQRTTKMSFEDILKQTAEQKDIKLLGQAPELYETVQKLRALEQKKPKTKDVMLQKALGLSDKQLKEFDDAELKAFEREKEILMGKGGIEIGPYFELKGKQAESLMKYLKETPGVDMEGLRKKAEQIKKEGLPGANEPRAPDEFEKQKGAMDAIMVTLRDSFNPHVDQAAKNLIALNDALKPLTAELAKAIANKDMEKAKEITKQIETEAGLRNDDVQPQANYEKTRQGIRR